MILPRTFTQRKPWTTKIAPANPRPGQVIKVEADRARARHLACERFQQEFHIFIAGYSCWTSMAPDGTWTVKLYDIELEDEGTENRTAAELERAIHARGIGTGNRCRLCGDLLGIGNDTQFCSKHLRAREN